jgi:ABC-2 type transport system permease protein
MIRGKGFGDIAGDLAILVGLSICFMIANVISLRKYRKV